MARPEAVGERDDHRGEGGGRREPRPTRGAAPSGRSRGGASASKAAANATANVTPNTPATTASRTVIGFETCDTPREPHVNPPSGQSPRSQSIAVQSGGGAERGEERAPGSAHERERGAEQRDRQRGE